MIDMPQYKNASFRSSALRFFVQGGSINFRGRFRSFQIEKGVELNHKCNIFDCPSDNRFPNMILRYFSLNETENDPHYLAFPFRLFQLILMDVSLCSGDNVWPWTPKIDMATFGFLGLSDMRHWLLKDSDMGHVNF